MGYETMSMLSEVLLPRRLACITSIKYCFYLRDYLGCYPLGSTDPRMIKRYQDALDFFGSLPVLRLLRLALNTPPISRFPPEVFGSMLLVPVDRLAEFMHFHLFEVYVPEAMFQALEPRPASTAYRLMSWPFTSRIVQ